MDWAAGRCLVCMGNPHNTNENQWKSKENVASCLPSGPSKIVDEAIWNQKFKKKYATQERDCFASQALPRPVSTKPPTPGFRFTMPAGHWTTSILIADCLCWWFCCPLVWSAAGCRPVDFKSESEIAPPTGRNLINCMLDSRCFSVCQIENWLKNHSKL